MSICQLNFHYCDKISEIIYLLGGKVCFDSWFQKDSVQGPMGLVALHTKHCRRSMGRGHHIYKQKEQDQKGQCPDTLPGPVPSSLTFPPHSLLTNNCIIPNINGQHMDFGDTFKIQTVAGYTILVTHVPKFEIPHLLILKKPVCSTCTAVTWIPNDRLMPLYQEWVSDCLLASTMFPPPPNSPILARVLTF